MNMNTNTRKLNRAIVVGVVLLAASAIFYGCKKTEPMKMEQQAAVAAASDANAAIEQKTCPVEGGVINKSLFTVYKGKKVYFCCPSCKPEFEKNPEKYISKLPQFAK
jgi:YHS domain-containing protein